MPPQAIPTVMFCDEAGVGAPFGGESRLWISAICVPESRLAELDSLVLSKGRRKNLRDRESVAALFRGQPAIVGAVGHIDLSDAEIASFYYQPHSFEGRTVKGTTLLWCTALASCCALVLTELYKLGSPLGPITVFDDHHTLKADTRTELESVLKSDLPRALRKVAEQLGVGQGAVPEIRLGPPGAGHPGGHSLADFFASGSRRAWQVGDVEFMKPFTDRKTIIDADLTVAALAKHSSAGALANPLFCFFGAHNPILRQAVYPR